MNPVVQVVMVATISLASVVVLFLFIQGLAAVMYRKSKGK